MLKAVRAFRRSTVMITSRSYTAALTTQERLAAATASAQRLNNKYFVDGSLREPVSGKTFDVQNPATLEVVAKAAKCEAADVDIAVQSANRAFGEWKKLPARQRGKLVQQCGEKLTKHIEELAMLVALETGKAIRTESRVEASVLSDSFLYFGGLASELKGETFPFSPDVLSYTVREPLGVVGAILPWNAPLLLMAIKIAPALVAGNTVVVKAAEEAPLTVLRIAELLSEVLPPGTFNLVTGMGPDCGAPLVSHDLVRKVTFTGSVETGKIIYSTAARKLIPVTLELGGKSPMIIAADADIDRAVDGAIGGMRFTRAGQSCTAASRILVHESLHDVFVEKLTAKIDKLKMGDPLDETTDIGTVITRDQLDRIENYVKLGLETPTINAHICSQLPADPKFAKGLYTRPVIFSNVDNTHRLAREEIFGPVACVLKFSCIEEAIEKANDTEFGLSATIWTADLHTALNAVNKLEAGIVQVNQNLVVQPQISFGGVKNSGLGKEASLESMLEHYTHKKTVMINLKK